MATHSADTPFQIPPELTGHQAWYGPDLAERRDWIESLSREEIAEKMLEAEDDDRKQ